MWIPETAKQGLAWTQRILILLLSLKQHSAHIFLSLAVLELEGKAVVNFKESFSESNLTSNYKLVNSREETLRYFF